MTNSPEKWAIQLHAAVQKLKESDIECAKAAAHYAEFESIIRKRSKLQLLEHSDCTNKTQLERVCKIEPKSAEGARRRPINKIEQKLRPVYSRQSERPSSKKQSLKKPNEDTVVPSYEQVQITQIQKRIKQYYKNNESIEELSRKYVNEKRKFLIHLEKLNSDTWKTHKSRNSVLEKLTAHMNAS